MKSINPACKFIGILIPTVLLLFFYSPILNMTVFVVCLAVLFISRCSKTGLAVAMVPVVLSAVALFFTGYHFPNNSHLALNYQLFANSAVWNGLQLGSRVLAFSGLGLLFVLTTDRLELIHSARQQFHVPVKFAYGLLAAWGMVPNMLREYSRAKAAFRARGLVPAPWSPMLLKPLLVKTVRWSESMAAAMESKGFGGKRERTEYYVMEVKLRDKLFPVLTTVVFFLMLLLSEIIISVL